MPLARCWWKSVAWHQPAGCCPKWRRRTQVTWKLHQDFQISALKISWTWRLILWAKVTPATKPTSCEERFKSESHLALCVCICVLCAYLVSQKNTEYVWYTEKSNQFQFCCVSRCLICKMCTVHNGSMDAIAAYGTQAARCVSAFRMTVKTQRGLRAPAVCVSVSHKPSQRQKNARVLRCRILRVSGAKFRKLSNKSFWRQKMLGFMFRTEGKGGSVGGQLAQYFAAFAFFSALRSASSRE